MNEIKLNLYNKETLYRSGDGVWAMSISDGMPLVIDEEVAIQSMVEAVQDLGYWCQVAKDILSKEQFEEVNYAVKYEDGGNE